MRPWQLHPLLRHVPLAVLLAALPSCGSSPAYDWKNREIPWTYGPTTGTASPEHLSGTGKSGGGAIAVGWKCRLSDGKNLTVSPYQLAESHPLFDKVVMQVGLFDIDGKQLAMVHSEAITAAKATFTFPLADAVAKQLNDVVIWFTKP